MWLIGGRNRRIRTIDGGKSFRARCPDCDQIATFSEVSVKTNYHVFFVDLYDDAETGVRCGACEEAFTNDEALEIIDRALPRTEEERVAFEERTLAKYRSEFEARARRRHEDAARAASIERQKQASEAAIDDELARLKKRLGK